MSSISSSAASDSHPLNAMNVAQPHPTRARPPPPPLRLQSSTYHTTPKSPSWSLSQQTSPPTLLYELPPSASATSPRTTKSPNYPRSNRSSHYHYPTRSPPPIQNSRPLGTPPPQSPPVNARRPSADRIVPTPPPRPRSITPSFANAPNKDLEIFATQCRAWFFNSDDVAGQAMSATLATLPPQLKADYTRIQASIRSAFHTSQSLRRLTEFRALLSSTLPGQSLPANLRVQPSSAEARKERLTRFCHFISNQCVSSAPGTHTFFEGLYTVLRLQALPANLGGAAEHRIEWEIDDAVFIESGGKDFTREAIDVIKGVLGFEEVLVVRPSDNSSSSLDLPDLHARVTEPTFSSLGESHYARVIPPPPPIRKPPPPPAPPLVQRNSGSLLLSTTGSSRSKGSPESTIQLPLPTPSQSTQTFRSRSRSRAASDPFIDPGKSSPGSSLGFSSPLSRTVGLSATDAIITEDEMEMDEAPTPAVFDSKTNLHSYGPSTPLEEIPPTYPLQSHSRSHSNPIPILDHLPPPTPPRTLLDMTLDDPIPSPSQEQIDLLNNPQLRVWTFPAYISNPELHTLIVAFPTFITKKSTHRFTPVHDSGKNKHRRSQDAMKTLEEGGPVTGDNETDGVGVRELRGEVKAGTGRMWVGEQIREDGWKGGLWTRIMQWFKGMFKH